MWIWLLGAVRWRPHVQPGDAACPAESALHRKHRAALEQQELVHQSSALHQLPEAPPPPKFPPLPVEITAMAAAAKSTATETTPLKPLLL
jgi:hypothetical protein